MPCESMQSSATTYYNEIASEIRSGISFEREEYQKKINGLKAALCALVNELKKLEKYDEFIKTASENSDFHLSSFIEEHTKEDEQRIIDSFNDYLSTLSKHEKSMLKQIFKIGE